MITQKYPRRFRQGDVMITQVLNPMDLSKAELVEPDKQRGVVLAWGEVTGHAHVLSPKVATMYKWEGDTLIEVKDGADVTHEEHSTINLPPGTYKITIQREYHREVVRNVVD